MQLESRGKETTTQHDVSGISFGFVRVNEHNFNSLGQGGNGVISFGVSDSTTAS